MGGRLATRNFAGGRFDYGAQFFTVRDPAFRRLADQSLAAGVVTPWSEGSRSPTAGSRILATPTIAEWAGWE